MIDHHKTWVLRASVITLTTLMVAACQTPYSADGEPSISGPRPNFPVRQEPQAPLPQPIPAPQYNPPAPEYVPPRSSGGAIESQPLSPPAPAYTAPSSPAPAYNPPAPAYTPPVTQPAPAEARPTANGRVVDASGPPRTHTVKSGDTLTSIGRQFGMTAKEVATLNKIDNPGSIRPGQKLKGPASKGKAYVVESGDTLSAIGRRFSVSAAQIAEANDMAGSTSIRPGQRLLLPSGYRDTGSTRVAAATPARPATPSRPVTPTPAPSQNNYPRPSQTPAPTSPRPTPTAPVIIPSTPAASSSDIAAAGRGKFIWPVNGRIVSGFGVRGPNQQSNGLNISSTTGTSVRAAAAGEVIYAGSEVQDYGNLVLIRHDDGFVTVYAHLSRILVKMQDKIRQSQEIGEVGQSGGLSEPQLYFEMRHQPTVRDMAKPFDPTIVLPPR